METIQISIEEKKLKKSMGLNLRFPHLTSTATPFKHMNFSRIRNKWSCIESKTKEKLLSLNIKSG
jgi:hypothetical protein